MKVLEVSFTIYNIEGEHGGAPLIMLVQLQHPPRMCRAGRARVRIVLYTKSHIALACRVLTNFDSMHALAGSLRRSQTLAIANALVSALAMVGLHVCATPCTPAQNCTSGQMKLHRKRGGTSTKSRRTDSGLGKGGCAHVEQRVSRQATLHTYFRSAVFRMSLSPATDIVVSDGDCSKCGK